MRVILPERPLEYVGWRALADAVFSITVTLLVILLASAIGLKLLNWLGANDVSNLEKGLFSAGLGLGFLAYFVLALSFAGFLIPAVLLASLLTLAIFSYREINSILGNTSILVSYCVLEWKRRGWINYIFIVIIALVCLCVLLETLNAHLGL